MHRVAAFFFFTLLIAFAAADGACKVIPSSEEGCNVPSCTCPTPFFECNSSGGGCVLNACTGTCRLSTIGYVIVIGVPLLIIGLITLICCCCCACCRCGGGGGGSREREVIIVQAPNYGGPSGDDWATKGRRR
jgi:hypothetical protein